MSGIRTAVSGMGAIPISQGVHFRVWAPFAEKVSVVGSFNDWDPSKHPLEREDGGRWAGLVARAKKGDEYRFWIKNGEFEATRIDPYAREVTQSNGNGVVYDPSDFDWGNDDFRLPTMNKLVIYELHIGTFREDGTFAAAGRRLDHLRRLGVNAIEIMPIAEFPGDLSWGYNPSHIFAVETAYGGPRELKKFIKKCHEAGLGVILDVVYNHLGPMDLDLWRFDGWHEKDKGGIYFYNDDRSHTPWGDTRPDYGRPEVRQFIRDNALMWLEDYRVDGLRFDSTKHIRTVDGVAHDIPDGWRLLQELSGEIRAQMPHKILIAEDLADNAAVTAPVEQGGAGFHAQWCCHFVHPVREAVITPEDDHRSMHEVARALVHRYNDDVYRRVVYSESHDEVANGKQRVVSEVAPDDPRGWYARKRSTLAGAVALTAPGIPMLFQGQEILQEGWFQDTVPLDWDLREEYRGIVRLYRDLIRLRLSLPALCGQSIRVFRVDDEKNILAYHRFEGNHHAVVVANFCNQEWPRFRIGMPCAGEWAVRFSSDDKRYSEDYEDELSLLHTDDLPWDEQPHSLELRLRPYTLTVLEYLPAGDSKP